MGKKRRFPCLDDDDYWETEEGPRFPGASDGYDDNVYKRKKKSMKPKNVRRRKKPSKQLEAE